MKFFSFLRFTFAGVVVAGLALAGLWIFNAFRREQVLRQVLERLRADSRVAEVIVTASGRDEASGTNLTTIKFLEYDVAGKPLEPRYFTFHGNVIQFQALVVRFLDELVEVGDRIRGRSAYIFLKAFALRAHETEVFEINAAREIPSGYKIEDLENPYEKKVWEIFWAYALDPARRKESGIKNVQIEAPGSLFLPGSLYTIVIEHDGGLRIDTLPIPEILKGEKVLP